MAGAAQLRMNMEIEDHGSMDHVNAFDRDLQDDAVGAQHEMLAGFGVDQNVLQRGQRSDINACGSGCASPRGRVKHRHPSAGQPNYARLEGAKARIGERDRSPMME